MNPECIDGVTISQSNKEVMEQKRLREIKKTISELRVISGTKKKDDVLPSSTNVFHTTVAIFIWSADPAAIVINSREVAESYESYFETFWKTAKP